MSDTFQIPRRAVLKTCIVGIAIGLGATVVILFTGVWAVDYFLCGPDALYPDPELCHPASGQ